MKFHVETLVEIGKGALGVILGVNLAFLRA